MAIDAAASILTRKVLFALELLDPFTGTPVNKGIRLDARTADGGAYVVQPTVNRSGRFVWLDNGGEPPANIRYDMGRLPFDSGRVELSAAFPNDRLVRIVLRPTAAYEVPEGVTAVRGTLVASEATGAKPVADAMVQLAWAMVQPAGWIPPVPASRARLRPGEAITDKDGQFLVLSRLPGKSATVSGYVGYPLPGEPGYDGARISLDVSGAGVKARLQVTRRDTGTSRRTPDDFRFDEALQPGRIPEGRLLGRDLKLDWNELS